MAEHADLPHAGHDERDAPLRPLLIGGALLLAFVVLMLGLARWMYPQSLEAAGLAQPAFPQPRLQSAPNLDYARFHADQLQALNTAAWTDASHGSVRVPIDTAMRKLAVDGIADWPTTPRRQQ